MSRSTRNKLKNSKPFYIETYHRGIKCLGLSLGVSFILILGNLYSFFTQPSINFYATSGITAPIALTPLSAPNNSSVALLPPDPPNDISGAKPIPQ